MTQLPPPDSTYNFSTGNANPTLMLYTQFEKYSTVFDISTSFNTITDINLTAQDSGLILSQIGIHPNKASSVGYLTTLVNPLVITPIAFTSTSIASTTDVSVSLTTSTTQEEQEISNISQALTALLLNDFSSDVVQSGSQGVSSYIDGDVTYKHNMMKQYLDDINKSLTLYQFNLAQTIFTKKFGSIVNSEANSYPKSLQLACISFGKMWDSQTKHVLDVMNTALETFFDNILNNVNLDPTSPLIQQLIMSLGFTNSYTSSLYYFLRTELISALQTSSSTSTCSSSNPLNDDHGQDVTLFMYKLMADTYIKVSYPLIQYIFIDRLMIYYMKKGDFTNTRLGLFAKIFFSLYSVSILSIAIQNIKTVPVASMSPIQDQMNDIIVKLNSYIQNMNNIDMDPNTKTTADQEINNIQNYLYSLSSQVQTAAITNQGLQADVQNLRLLIRNVGYNTEIMWKINTRKKLEFWVITIVTFLVTLACVTLLILQTTLPQTPPSELFLKLVYYTAGCALVLVILYQLIMFMYTLLNKN